MNVRPVLKEFQIPHSPLYPNAAYCLEFIQQGESERVVVFCNKKSRECSEKYWINYLPYLPFSDVDVTNNSSI